MPMTAITLNLDAVVHLSDEQFYELCQANPELQLERTATGELIAMSPTGGETGRTNATVNALLWNWNDRHQLGIVFDSSTGFKLPNGADRSPDAAWIEKSRWAALTPAQKQKFIPLCPDFVIEIQSATDSRVPTQQKMQEYIDNGCRLGWLIDSRTKTVAIYQPGTAVEILDRPQTVSGAAVLPEFELSLDRLWE
jgi:Uma2 family endonuclease